LILDEPECHLHPDWQNKFAEIVVLLVKEIGCHVLLTTHSQNFLLALDAMSRIHKIKDRSNFYQAVKSGNSVVNYVDVSQNLKPIYADFVKGFSEMKNLYDSIVNL
jgi:predicted ATPase